MERRTRGPFWRNRSTARWWTRPPSLGEATMHTAPENDRR